MIVNIFLISHFLADFTFQSNKFSKKKNDNFKYFIYNTLIYSGILFIGIFSIINIYDAIFPFIIIISFHFIVDWIRKTMDIKFREKSILFISFVLDQILHIFIIIFLYHTFNLDLKSNTFYSNIVQWKYFNRLIIYSLTFVILWEPSAVFIKIMLNYILDNNGINQEKNNPQIGRLIGKLERIIISILIFCNQFGAIGFILTAKSIARYKQLEDKKFAEKYLVGTLASIAISFIVTIVFKEFL